MAAKGLLVGASQNLLDATKGADASSSLAAELLGLVKGMDLESKTKARRLMQGLGQIEKATQVRAYHEPLACSS